MRVAVAEDVALMREGIVAILERGGHEVPWQARDAVELWSRLRTDLPDVLVVDVRMPPRNADDGLQVALRLRAENPQVAILVLSQHLGNEYARRLLAGALDAEGGTGYLLKERIGHIGEFLAAVAAVGEGEIRIDPKVVAHLMREPRPSAIDFLSPREAEVLALIAEGRTNAQIALAMHLADSTVERHVTQIFSALGLQSHDGNRRVLAVLEYLKR